MNTYTEGTRLHCPECNNVLLLSLYYHPLYCDKCNKFFMEIIKLVECEPSKHMEK